MSRTLLILFAVIGYVSHWVTLISGVIALVAITMALFGDTNWWFDYFGWSIMVCLGAGMIMVMSMQAQQQLKNRLT